MPLLIEMQQSGETFWKDENLFFRVKERNKETF